MKTRRIPALCAALAFALTACGGGGGNSTAETAATPAPAAEPAAVGGEMERVETMGAIADGSYVLNAGDCGYATIYREMQPGGNLWGLETYLILKIDYETGIEAPYCSLPGCTHDSVDCPAWVPTWNVRLFLLDGTLYLLRPDLSATVPLEEIQAVRDAYDADSPEYQQLEALYNYCTQPAGIEKVTPEGRTNLLESSRNVGDVVGWDGTTLYALVDNGEMDGICWNMETGAESSWKVGKRSVVGGYGADFLTVRTVAQEDIGNLQSNYTAQSTAYNDAVQRLEIYDPRTGQATAVHDWLNAKYWVSPITTKNDTFYYYCRGGDIDAPVYLDAGASAYEVRGLDLNSGEEFTLYVADGADVNFYFNRVLKSPGGRIVIDCRDESSYGLLELSALDQPTPMQREGWIVEASEKDGEAQAALDTGGAPQAQMWTIGQRSTDGSQRIWPVCFTGENRLVIGVGYNGNMATLALISFDELVGGGTGWQTIQYDLP